ncbi:hypothetical protein GCM10023185_19820 [Hymenobacter saemangeumensis]|uniref:Ig-like domain-containing protein n=1 Tax=Hymenobacter saemangeumensis TaxID=1084522 RepID=A0ABP8IDL9_9BACT
MKKLLHSTTLLLLSWCLALAGIQQARASHILGGQLTYVNVGPNQYVVTLYLYRDCSGAGLPGSMTLTVRPSTSCTATPAPTYPMNPVPNSISVGTQYCPAQQPMAACTSNASLPNYETEQYRTGTITIAPGQWTMSTEICCRPSTANLQGQGNFRYEATLNNRIVVNGQNVDIQNSSAQYSPLDIPVPFVYVNQRTTIGFNTTDPNNTPVAPSTDSLVYSLTTPLDQCNVPVAYKPYPGSGPVLVPGSNPPCYILPPANTPSSFTAALPIAVGFNTSGMCPVLQGTTNLFSFDAGAGQFTFTTPRYINTAPSAGDNKYVVVGKVDEYRRLPGFGNRRFLVGSVRREIVVIIIQGLNNVPQNPTGTPVTPGAGTTITQTVDSLEVTIQPCNYSQVFVRFTDPDPQDLLTVTYTGVGDINTNILESGDIGTYTLIGNGTSRPVARFLFQPSPAFAGRVLRIPFQIQDNGCPVRGLQTRVLVVRIAPTRRDLALASTAVGMSGLGNTNVASVCPGGRLTLQGSIGRPDSTNGRLQTYTYAWTGNGIVGAANTRNITVAPLVTTRYRLNVNPDNGFQIGVCADTSSVLVRVVPEPTVSIAANNQEVCPGNAIVLTATATRNDNLTDVYTYEWTGPGVPANTTGQTVTVRPTAAGTYTVVARGNRSYDCEATSQIQLRVAPAAVAGFARLDSISARPGSRSLIPPVVFKFRNTAALNPANNNFQIESAVWTYQRVRNAQGQAVTEAPVQFSTERSANAEVVTPGLRESGYYIIKQTVYTRAAGANCPENSFQRTVFVPNIQVPNIITPNGDNLNDVFVVNSDQYNGKLEIFNRWGRKVEEFNAYQNTWDGKGQPDGVYYYYLTDRTGNKTKGWVEIVRGQ